MVGHRTWKWRQADQESKVSISYIVLRAAQATEHCQKKEKWSWGRKIRQGRERARWEWGFTFIFCLFHLFFFLSGLKFLPQLSTGIPDVHHRYQCEVMFPMLKDPLEWDTAGGQRDDSHPKIMVFWVSFNSWESVTWNKMFPFVI